jgi:PTS system fructose-specific IIC component
MHHLPHPGKRIPSKKGEPVGTGAKIRSWLMTGVSYMIPFVAAGGILIALSFMLTDPVEVVKVSLSDALATNNIPALIFQLGASAFGFLVPVLAGYIAFAIADRPGIAPGFVAGAIAGAIGAGFLGGLLGGLLAGLVAKWISDLNVPSALRSLMPIVVTPLGTILVIGFAMGYVIGKPITNLNQSLTNWLGDMSTGSAVVLGLILGLMMAFDMGGPVNKVAYTFAAGGLSNAAAGATDAKEFVVMAAVMAAGMTPPLGLALATVLRRRLFSEAEHENGKAAWVLGASFITEGAIPFAAADPIRVIPSIMVGSGITGALVMAFESTLRAPHGGIWVLPLIGGVVQYVIAILIGMVVTAGLVIVLKSVGSRESVNA